MPATTVRVTAPAHRWNTLQLLRTGRLLLLLLDALLLLALLSAGQAHRRALKTIGEDAAPSIIAAQGIKTAIAGMDAEVANQLLNRPENTTSALASYDSDRKQAATSLVTAAENITYGDAERLPIETLQNGLSMYEDLAQRARDLHETAARINASSTAAAVTVYRQAEAMTDRTLLPAAEELDAANDRVLETTYHDQSFWSAGSRLFIMVAAVAVLFALALTQILLSQRMHRTLNPPLLAASLLLAALAFYGYTAVSSSHRALRQAKEDAFTSVRALWRARATAYAANADESRFLLDPAHAAEHQSSFTVHADALAVLPANLSADQLIAAEREGHSVDGFTGYLADELNNITYPGEREAALQTLAAWERYLSLDQRLRDLGRAGKHEEAVQLCVGTEPGESDWAFARFDAALVRTLAINQSAFTGVVQEGFADLRNLEWVAGIAAIVAAALIVWGFAPRIREYL